MAKQPQHEITTFYYTRMVKPLSICCLRNVNERPPMPLALQIPDIFQFILCTEKGTMTFQTNARETLCNANSQQQGCYYSCLLSVQQNLDIFDSFFVSCIHSQLIFPYAIYSIVMDLLQTIYFKNNKVIFDSETAQHGS